MDNERKQLWRIIEPVVVCFIFAGLYAAGGSADFGGLKWLRRYLAPGLFCIWAFARSIDWRYFVQLPLMIGGLCLPYGADSTGMKIVLRGVFGLANGTASSLRNLTLKFWALSIAQILLVTITSIALGVWNQMPNAMVEQFAIGFLIVFIPALSVSKKKE